MSVGLALALVAAVPSLAASVVSIAPAAALDNSSPVRVSGSNGWRAVSVGAGQEQDNGFAHVCTIVTTGKVRCQGYGAFGEMGNGTTTSVNSYPVEANLQGTNATAHVSTSTGPQIASYERATCAIVDESGVTGGVQCWGRNNDGQLGDNTNTQRSTPVRVQRDDYNVPSLSLGDVSPRSSVNNNFAVRYSKSFTTTSAVPSFIVNYNADDFARVYLTQLPSGTRTLIGDHWTGTCCQGWTTTSQSLAAATSYRIEVEMRDTGGGAALGFSANTPGTALWDSLSWKTEWFNATDTAATTGTPVRTDSEGLTANLTGATAVAGNAFDDSGAHFCAVANGGLFCWGRNGSGELGDGTTTDRWRAVNPLPETTVTANKVTGVAAGPGFSCAVINGGASGSAKCWGDNDDGQLGTVGVSNGTDYTAPANVKADASNNLTGIADIAAGGWHTCGLMNDKTVRCWGKNDRGQAGNGVASGTDIAFPTTVKGLGGSGNLSDVRSLTSGHSHNCATVSSSGNLYCWGFNANGQLGDGTTNQATTPIRMIDAGQSSGSTNFMTDVSLVSGGISAGTSITCIVKTDGTMACTGKNANGGELGDGTQTQRLSPVWVNGAGPDLWSAAAIGGGIVDEGTGSHSCVVTTANQIKCWGWGGLGQVGNNTTGTNSTPVQVTLSATAGASPVASKSITSGSPIAGSNSASCVIFNSATVTGGVQCWGRNNNGELGDGTTSSHSNPLPVLKGAGPGTTYLSGVTAIAMGQSDGTGTGQPTHVCALANGGVFCWGYNKSGELGNGAALGNTGANSSPVQAIAAGSGILGIAVGNANTCAITAASGSNLKCWGYNAYGQLGDASTTTRNAPTLTTAGNVAQVSLGTFHQCLVNTSSQVWCVGRNRSGDLGINNQSDQTGYQRVLGVGGSGFLPNATTVAAGLDETCAVAGGEVYCWGADDNGKLGRGTTGSGSNTAVKVIGLAQVSGSTTTLSGVATDSYSVLGANSQGFCARLASGAVNCWGRDNDGELGSGTLFSNYTTISGSAAPSPNAAGWNKSNVTVSWTCSTRSPATITSCPSAQVFSTEGTGLSASGTTVDSSGFDSSATVSGIKLDKTNPTGSGALQGTPTNTWYTGDVTVAWTCADALSGVKTCPANSTITGEGSSLTTTATTVDNADNSQVLTSPVAKIDRTKTSTSISAIPTWSTSNVTVTLTPSDNLSGVASTSYTVDGGSLQSGTSIPVTSEGVHTITYASTDVAGNVETTKNATVRIDKTAPTISADKSPAPNAAGWNKANVTVSFTCSDGTSGVASCTAPVTVSSDTTDQIVSGTAVDVAGNSSGTSTTVKLDKTPPTITASATPAANGAGWNNSNVTVSYTCSDATSGIATCPSSSTVSTEGTGLSASGTAFDAADNSTGASVTGIKLDKTAPTITGVATSSPNGDGWYNEPVTIQWTCGDTLSGVVSCPADEVVSGNGAVTAQRNIVDNAGNETVGSVTVLIDTVAPTITGAPTTSPDADGYYSGPVTVHWSCGDASSGSGVTTCPADETVSTSGSHTLTQTVSDRAGNVSAPAQVTFTIHSLPSTPGFGSAGSPLQVRYAETRAVDPLEGATGDGDELDSFTQPSHGTVTLDSGLLVYAPTGEELGADQYTFTLADDYGRHTTGTVYLTVTLPAAPTAGYGGSGTGTGTADTPFTTPYLTPITIPALASSAGYHLSVSAVTSGAHGTVVIDSGGGDPVYTPASGWAGLDTFTYTVQDGFGQTDTATAYVRTDQPAGPVTPDSSKSVQAPGTLTLAAPGVFDNVTGTGVTITGHTDPAHGSLSLNSSTGAYSYTPTYGYDGPDSFTYTVTDGFARSATGTVHITVDPPDAPTAVDQDVSTPYQTALVVAAPGVLTGATGTGISVTSHTDPAHGSVTVAADGAYAYTPASGYGGHDAFSATVTDDYGQTATVHVGVTVGYPASPVLVGSSVEVTFQTPKTVPAPGVLAGSSGTGLSVTGNTEPAHGDATVAADGGYTYTPHDGYIGADSFDVTATDAFGRTSTATVAVDVVAAQTTTTLDVTPSSSTFGQSVALTATVATPADTPAGTVTFYDGTTNLGTLSLASGQATLTTTGLSVSSHSLSAAFTPSGATHRSSTSDTVTLVVGKASTSTVVTSSANPAMVTQAVTFTATVSGPGGTPTGSVTFYDGSTSLGTVSLSSGQATLTTSALSATTHSIKATYDPTGTNYLGSTSAPISQVVTPPLSVTNTISSSFNTTSISSGRYIWFDPVAKVRNLGSNAVTVKVTNASVTYGTTTVSVPDAWVTFDPLASKSTTTFDAANNRWVTTIPTSVAASGNSVIGGIPIRTTAVIPGGLTPVSWTATFSTVTPGIDIDWKWSAAVYTSFNTNLAGIGLKPVDDKTTSNYLNSDLAGTPESYKSYVTAGAKGSGGTIYTGTYTPDTVVRPT
jgi:alpha-tubulin suppressor-like RCC1 family protein